MAQKPLDAETRNAILQAVALARLSNPALPEKGSGGKKLSVRSVAVAAMVRSGWVANTADRRFLSVERNHPEEWAFAMSGRFVPVVTAAAENDNGEAAPKVRTLEDDVQLHRAETRSREAVGRLRDAHAKIARLEDRLSDYQRAASSSARPAEWTLQPSTDTREHMPYLLASDFQVGEVIRPEETDNAHGYDIETFRARYRRLISKTVELCLTHQKEWTYPGIIYARGGDTISGAIHQELLETDEVTPIEAVEIAFEEEAAGIRQLADAFGRVDTKAVGGNHDRDTHKPQSKRAGAHSYERLVSYMLQREFANDPRVTFQTSQSPDVYFAIYGTRILLTHGDKIGSRGGQGFVGPAATIMRGAQKVIAEQMALGRPVDEVHMGHFHTPLELGYALANGCLPGYSEYAKLLRCRPEAPSQWLAFYHPRYGKVGLKKIWLEEPRPAGVDWLPDMGAALRAA